MSRPHIPYGHQLVDDDDIADVVAVLKGDWLTTGPAVTGFECALSELVGGSPVVAVSSGTAALHCAYAAAGLGPGDELITTPLTFAATAYLALHLGARVVFADVLEETLTLDPEAVSSLVGNRTKVVATVDYAGHPSRVDELDEVARTVDAILVEDAAHSIGGRYRGRPVGSVAPLTVFSFHPVKTITTGEGGAVVARDGSHEEAVRRFRDHGLVRDRSELRLQGEGPWHQEVQSLGLNYRMSDIAAALGRSQLRKLDRFVSRRRELVQRYRRSLADVDGIRLLGWDDDVDPAWHLFPVRITDGRRAVVFDRLRSEGLGVQVHYLPAHWHPVFADMGYRPGVCPIAEAAYQELISLPLFPGLSDPEQDRVIETVRRAVEA